MSTMTLLLRYYSYIYIHVCRSAYRYIYSRHASYSRSMLFSQSIMSSQAIASRDTMGDCLRCTIMMAVQRPRCQLGDAPGGRYSYGTVQLTEEGRPDRPTSKGSLAFLAYLAIPTVQRGHGSSCHGALHSYTGGF